MELLAGEVVFADLEIGVGEVLADGGALRGEVDGLEELADGGVVVAGLEGGVGLVERLGRGVVGHHGRLRQ